MINNDTVKILKSYRNINLEINRLKDEQKHYKELLSCDDLSELEYYKKDTQINITFRYMIYSSVEMEVINKEKLHNLNGAIIRQLLSKTTTLLQELKNRKTSIDNALKYLNIESQYIVRLKFFESMTYKNIRINFQKKFKRNISENSIKIKVKKSINIIDIKLNKIYFS